MEMERYVKELTSEVNGLDQRIIELKVSASSIEIYRDFIGSTAKL